MRLFSTVLLALAVTVWADTDIPEVDDSVNIHGDGTDDDATAKAAEATVLDGFSADEMEKLRESSEEMEFQAEVNRMMKLIINSLYKNKVSFSSYFLTIFSNEFPRISSSVN